jgi:cytochrome d ubiquinol oxidase subunit II
MVIGWYLLLGLLMVLYFALAGYDYGVGLQLRGDDGERRAALNAIGPFFLGNEVWVIGAVGVLLCAFPVAEAELFTTGYPLVVVMVLGLVGINAGVQLRSRGDRRPAFDRLIAASSLALGVGWGMLLGAVLAGLPAGSFQAGRVFGWFQLLCGAALVSLFWLHGAVYLSWRAPKEVAEAARVRVRRVLPRTQALVTAAVVGGLISSQVRHAIGQPVPAIVFAVLLLVLPALAGLAVYRGRYRIGFLCSVLSATMPVLLVGFGRYPEVLGGLTVSDAASAPDTLNLLSGVALPLIPVLILVQALNWWVFRQRADRPAPTYW